MRFGIHLPHLGPSATPQGLTAFARAAEQLGFDSLWVSDHIALPPQLAEVFGAGMLEPLTALTYVAGMTRRIRLGTSVLVLPYRDPLVTAKMLASLDVLSEGRLIVGIAAGWLEAEFAGLGLKFAERGKQTDEYLAILLKAWRSGSGTLEHEGRYRSIHDLVFSPRPVQPSPPLWVGGSSPAAIRRAARFGSVWHPFRLTPAEVAAGAVALKRAAKLEGRAADSIEISVRVPLWFCDQPGHARSAPPLVGTADELVSCLRQYARAGASHVLVDFFLGIHHEGYATDPQRFMAGMERFATQVMPRVGARSRGAHS